MALNANARRRWLGAIFLIASVLMLVAGETVLKSAFGPLGFLAYWVVCLALTGLAMLVALLDARVVRQRSLQEQHKLLDATIAKIRSGTEPFDASEPKARKTPEPP